MNRNTESRFSLLPSIDMPRSRFDRSASVKTTFNTGDVIPFCVEEVLPGDTFNIQTSKVVRMQTLLTPIMDNVYLDTYWFFVPNRLVWDHWKEFCGENTESAWIPQTEYSIPIIKSPDDSGFRIGTIADYMGIPTGVPGLEVNALPFRAYALVMNEWFRDQNLSDPLLIPKDDSTVIGTNGSNYVVDVAKGGRPFKAAKYHDYFTSCLPSPQKGPDVTLPVLGDTVGFGVYGDDGGLLLTDGSQIGVLNARAKSTSSSSLYSNLQFSPADLAGETPQNPKSFLDNVLGVPTYEQVEDYKASTGLTGTTTGLYALVEDNMGCTINQLRMAFQIQKYYEQLARGGSRYIEVVRSFFGVTSPDARLQRPEYLGGNRVPINVNQVIQQSGTESTGTPQGTVVGMSQTTDSHADFTKSFTEHGFIIGLMVARYDHSYQQGLNRMWSRRDKFDYYWPVFANIGEQAVKNKEIFAQGSNNPKVDNEVFGYQEAWADYRYRPSIVTCEMRSTAPESLDVWHLADDYETLPHLSDTWIRENKGPVNRVLAVTSENSRQFFADIYIKNYCTRPMPMYSIPGLIDHH